MNHLGFSVILAIALICPFAKSNIFADENIDSENRNAGIIGRWIEVNRKYSDLNVSDKLEINTPFGKQQLRWVPITLNKGGSYVVQVKRDAGCNTTQFWLVGTKVIPITNYSKTDYFDEVIYSIDPDGLLHMEVLDRKQKSNCTITTESSHFLFKRDAEEMARREAERVAAEEKARKIAEEKRRLEEERQRLEALESKNTKMFKDAVAANDLNGVKSTITLKPIAHYAISGELIQLLRQETFGTSKEIARFLLRHVWENLPDEHRSVKVPLIYFSEDVHEFIKTSCPEWFEKPIYETLSDVVSAAGFAGKNRYRDDPSSARFKIENVNLAIKRLVDLASQMPLSELVVTPVESYKNLMYSSSSVFVGKLSVLELAAFDPTFPVEVFAAIFNKLSVHEKWNQNNDFLVTYVDYAAVGANLFKQVCQGKYNNKVIYDAIYKNSYEKFSLIKSSSPNGNTERTGSFYRPSNSILYCFKDPFLNSAVVTTTLVSKNTMTLWKRSSTRTFIAH